MLKFLKIIFILMLFSQSPLYSKTSNKNDFNSKDFSNYFSALISYNNQKNLDALRFFNLSKSMINEYDPYLKKYIFSLILDGKVKKAIKEINNNLDKKNSDFFEAYLLLFLNSVNKNNFKESSYYLEKISKFKDYGTLELIVYESLKNYLYTFKNKKINNSKNTFPNLSLVNKTFQSCYLENKETNVYFANLINNPDIDYSRYLFFYINYLIDEKKFNEIKEITSGIDTLSSTLLVLQLKNWIDKKNFHKISEIFSCKSESDILSEFFFIIANIYSTQEEYETSNLFLNISNFLNPKFKFNLSLIIENNYSNNNYYETEKLLNRFNKRDDIYYWYKIKKKTQIISNKLGQEKAINYINNKFEKIENPSIKILLDMGNIAKGYKKYQSSINYYDIVISKTDKNSKSYSDLLYKRGGSYERIGKYEESDKDLLKSLEINPNDAYVLNYLAYSWLERSYKIESAIQMLDEAYNQKSNDPYIIDSVGWGYYLINDFINSEKFLKKALQLMPNDPIVNDHYGDVLWQIGRKIEAKYYWENVLNFKDTEDEMKKDIYIKLLKGPEKI
jgi:hypothetical protein